MGRDKIMSSTPARSPKHTRASSVPLSPEKAAPPAYALTPVKSAAATSLSTSPRPAAHDGGAAFEPAPKPTSVLHPRVAVMLNVPTQWHAWLFALRLGSILPAIRWGTPSALHLLLRLLQIVVGEEGYELLREGARCRSTPWTESVLGCVWCFASGYLSFFFTDCLMSRWLINYTPQATIVRLLAINAVNAYITSTVLSLAGGFQDTRLLLPGWIGIATTLTVCYHITHQKINIRKETSTSLNVFSIASYITMLTLLVHMYTCQPEYPVMPVVTKTKHFWNETMRITEHVRDTIEKKQQEL